MSLDPHLIAHPFAHRGLHDLAAGRIENSRAAILAAVEEGYAVELDLQLSSDGEAIVFHDDTLNRLTGETGPIRARSAAELGRVSLSGGRETIPTFAEILSLVAGRATLLVEIKDQGGRFDETGVGPLEARAASLLADYEGPALVMSFNPAAVAELARLAPERPRGLTAMAARRYSWRLPPAKRMALATLAGYEPAGCSFVSYDHRSLPTPQTEALRARGETVLSWTLRTPEEAEAALRHSDAVTFEGYRPPPPA